MAEGREDADLMGDTDALLRFRDDAVHDEPAVTLEAFLDGQAEATAVRLEAGDDARALVPHLARLVLVEVSFPSFRDGARLYRGTGAARGGLHGRAARGGRRAGRPAAVHAPLRLRQLRARGADRPGDARPLARPLCRVLPAAADAAVPVWRLRHG